MKRVYYNFFQSISSLTLKNHTPTEPHLQFCNKPTKLKPMATNFTSPNNNLYASIDMGTNSFKLLIIHTDPSGKFLTIDRAKHPVLLGLDPTNTISPQSQLRSLESLKTFKQILNSHNIRIADRTRCVATSAVREATNNKEFVATINENTGLVIDVLSGEEEARLIYLGVLQFLPVYDKLVLTVDIGGGSTEFVIGKQGKVIFGTSLKLGHLSLTQKFVSESGVLKMREFVRLVIEESRLVEKVKECGGFEVVVGSSGTIRAIEKAVFNGYGKELVDSEVFFSEFNKRDWRFSRGELSSFVERLCSEENKSKRDMFFKRRSEFIVAGAVLLEEIFEVLNIEEMEVSGYALGEGVIAESLGRVFDGYDLYANARWRSVVRLATRFNGKKRMKSGAQCASIAKEIFEGLRKCDELADNQVKLTVSLDDKDLEYLEAACLLHNIGLFSGKKGYHKQSYRIIMNGDHLHGYSTEEVKLIALLARHHRKKFPKFGRAAFKEFPEEKKQIFRMLCAIMRISVILQQYQWANFQGMEFSHSHEGFNLVFREVKDQPPMPGILQPMAEDTGAELRQELDYFKKVFQQELLVVLPSCTSESSEK